MPSFLRTSPSNPFLMPASDATGQTKPHWPPPRQTFAGVQSIACGVGTLRTRFSTATGDPASAIARLRLGHVCEERVGSVSDFPV